MRLAQMHLRKLQREQGISRHDALQLEKERILKELEMLRNRAIEAISLRERFAPLYKTRTVGTKQKRPSYRDTGLRKKKYATSAAKVPPGSSSRKKRTKSRRKTSRPTQFSQTRLKGPSTPQPQPNIIYPPCRFVRESNAAKACKLTKYSPKMYSDCKELHNIWKEWSPCVDSNWSKKTITVQGKRIPCRLMRDRKAWACNRKSITKNSHERKMCKKTINTFSTILKAINHLEKCKKNPKFQRNEHKS